MFLRQWRARSRGRQLWRVEGPRILEETTTTTALLAAAAQARTAFEPVSAAVTRVGLHLDRLAGRAPTAEARNAAVAVATRLRAVRVTVASDASLRVATPRTERRVELPGPVDPILIADLDELGRHVESVVSTQRRR